MPKTIKMTPSEFRQFMLLIQGIITKPHLRPAFKQFAEDFAGDVGVNFLQSKDPSGGKWKALKNRRPKGRNQGTRPLIDTGDLLTSLVKSGSKGSIEKYTDTSLVYGTRISYASIHQLGGKRIPKRKFLGFTDEHRKQVKTLIRDLIEKQISTVSQAFGA